ncbi:hypothetical protein TTHERM_01035520 (macronuclear) [Tetrahymena thermophila SB210]|uniref:Uncharacterized protein n=1 Tax=Tetrahymena thermophila (strain SB210) TaxID=312017 RepID=Q24IA8_TETTS|nr:hypothetical protein TTHERM_01035520 [Tetrahymena thermophila SB210]EAS07489.1 hypothetical protein TTHERM_01035520 [Tetrahymena thermophila SB210]|eukprot:XP_001027731.1 hypothetical protein TTHERM_01035520 [Tetrahymena thermophila SB210]
MDDRVDIENLNLPISNILGGFQSDIKSKCSLTEQELREIQDELYEFVPIDDEELEEELSDDNDDGEEEDDEEECEDNEDQQNNEEVEEEIEQQNQENLDNDNSNNQNYEHESSKSQVNHQEFRTHSQTLNQNSCEESNFLKSYESSSEEQNDEFKNTQLSSTNQLSITQQSINSQRKTDISSQNISEKQLECKKKKKISKQKKSKDAGVKQTKVSYVDIYRKRESSQKCSMKLKVPYTMPQSAQSYFLMGDVLIEMDFSSINNNDNLDCIINLYKPVQRVVYNKKTRCLSMFQASSNEFLVDFNFLSKLLIEYPDQNIHLVGKLIEKYQEITKLIHLQIKNARTLTGFSQDLIAKRRAYFDEQVNLFLEKIDEHQMYFVQKFQTNYVTSTFEAYEVGYSRQFLALLGTDEQTITNIIFRQGKPELYNFESRLKMMLVRMLSIVQGRFKGAQSDFEIYTLDNIRVYSKLKILPVCIEYPPHLRLPIDNYNEISCMAFGLIDVEPNMIQQIITLRKQDKYHSHLKSLVQELNYTKQSEEFLEKYYEKSKNKYLKDRQNLQKRKQITKDNEQILIGHQQMQIEYNQDQQKQQNNNNQSQCDNQINQNYNQYEEKSYFNQGYFSNDFLGQSIYEDNSQFKYINSEYIDQNSNQIQNKCELESELIRQNHFYHIDDSYIAQDVHLARGDQGHVQLVQSYPEPAVSSNQPLNSSFISPATNLKNVFAKSHRIIQFNDNGNHKQLDSIQFEFKIV